MRSFLIALLISILLILASCQQPSQVVQPEQETPPETSPSTESEIPLEVSTSTIFLRTPLDWPQMVVSYEVSSKGLNRNFVTALKESKDYGRINDVFYDGEKLYVLFQMEGTSKANLMVYDLSDPSSPSLVTEIRYGMYSTVFPSVLKTGNLLAIFESYYSYSHMLVFDESSLEDGDQSTPLYTFEFQDKLKGSPKVLEPGVLVVPFYSGVEILQLDESTASTLAKIAVEDFERADLDGTLLAVMRRADFPKYDIVDLYDLSDPSSPKLLGSFPTELSCLEISLTGGALFANSVTGEELRVWDVSDPSSPTFVRRIDDPDGGKFRILGKGNGGIVVEISGPGHEMAWIDGGGEITWRVPDVTNASPKGFVIASGKVYFVTDGMTVEVGMENGRLVAKDHKVFGKDCSRPRAYGSEIVCLSGIDLLTVNPESGESKLIDLNINDLYEDVRDIEVVGDWALVSVDGEEIWGYRDRIIAVDLLSGEKKDLSITPYSLWMEPAFGKIALSSYDRLILYDVESDSTSSWYDIPMTSSYFDIEGGYLFLGGLVYSLLSESVYSTVVSYEDEDYFPYSPCVPGYPNTCRDTVLVLDNRYVYTVANGLKYLYAYDLDMKKRLLEDKLAPQGRIFESSFSWIGFKPVVLDGVLVVPVDMEDGTYFKLYDVSDPSNPKALGYDVLP